MAAKLNREEKAAKSRKGTRERKLVTVRASYDLVGVDKAGEHVLGSVKTADAASGLFQVTKSLAGDKYSDIFIRKLAIMALPNSDGE